jgi:hypothetical protein
VPIASLRVLDDDFESGETSGLVVPEVLNRFQVPAVVEELEIGSARANLHHLVTVIDKLTAVGVGF